jgi:hypothetical protein
VEADIDWPTTLAESVESDPKLTSAITACRELERQAIQNESKNCGCCVCGFATLRA